MKKTLLFNILLFIYSFFTSKKESKQSLYKIAFTTLLVWSNFSNSYSQCSTAAGGVNRDGLEQICINSSTGTMTLGNGYVGTILNWQKRLNNAATWTDITNTTNTYSEIPSSAGTWEYRAYVSNNGCANYSGAYKLIVKPEVVITPAAVAEAIQFSSSALLPYTGNNSDQFYIKFDAAAEAAGMNNYVQSGPIFGSTGNITIQIPPCTAIGTYNATLYTETYTPKCTSTTYNFAVVVKPNVNEGGTLNSDQTICNNTAPNDLELIGGGMYEIIKWQSSTDAAFTNPRDIPSSAGIKTLTSSQIGTLTQNTYFRVIGTASGCNKTSSNVILVSISAPPATFNPTPPSSVCVDTNVTYTTQSGKSNYIWTIPGTANLDYRIESGGISTASNSVTLKWLTRGSKTVTVNYQTSCSTASANATNTITVSKTERGVVNGGRTICKGTDSPELTLNNYQGTIVRWQYAEAIPYVWKDFAHTDKTFKPGILTTDTSYRAIVKDGNCDEGTAIETRINLEVTPTIDSQSTPTQTQCIGQAFDPLTVSVSGIQPIRYQWYSNTTASTTNATSLGNANGANSNKYTPQSTTAGTLYYYCAITGSCSTQIIYSAFSGQIITKAAPKIGDITQPNCNIPTGSVVLENVPHSGKLLDSQGNSYDFTTSGTTFEISGLVPGKYKFAIDDICKTYSSEIEIKPARTNIWNGAKWSEGTPDSNQRIEFTGNYDLDTDVSGCSCVIDDGANVTIKLGRTLTITNAITVLQGGTLSFKNNSSLMQTNNDPSINSGDISYERISTPIFQKDYIYWSSPVKNQKLGDLSPETDPQKFFFNDGTNWVFIDRSNNMNIGKGYIIRGPLSYSNSTKQTFPAIFKGVPNNGSLEGELLSKGKYHFIGNPYPSALNADALISQNSTLLNGTIYFWTHNTPINSSLSPDYQYTTDDYATYNLSGGVSAKSDKNHNNPEGVDNGIKPTGKIAAGQSFFVSTRTEGKVQFNNTMRVGGTNNGQFFKSGNTEKEVVLEKNRIWLNMTNDKGAFKQLLVGYIEGATNFYENRYDGITFDGNTYLDFYSVNNGNKFVIQGRALPFDDSDIVPLGYRAAMEGAFTISIDEVDGKMKNQAIYIEDKVTGKIHDLRNSNYTFKTAIGTFTDRLILRYTDKTLGTGDFENIEDGILISVKNKTVNVLSSKENIKDVTIFDITGKMLYSKNKVSNTELQIQNLPSSNQVLLVKVTLDNDFTTTRKIIFQ
ncbi:T9SS sorting signal type C domain-containing protein [Flavobacterium bizetiae]|uniref:T9SS sorting signal type C domain-containing protein n=1 Tax=Flavobacterium bizetiae TaxID=2704140 RepID=UPI0037574093